MKVLRPLAGYTSYDHKTNDSVRCKLQTECILDKIDEYRRNRLLHLQRMPLNRIPLKSYHYRPQGRRNIGENSCNSGDGTDKRVQSLMFMMMMTTISIQIHSGGVIWCLVKMRSFYLLISHTGLRTPCGCAKAQAVSFQSLSVETKVQSQANICRITSGTIGTQTILSPRTLVF
jgi:hypothetical protein